jgi:hypothetical protein
VIGGEPLSLRPHIAAIKKCITEAGERLINSREQFAWDGTSQIFAASRWRKSSPVMTRSFVARFPVFTGETVWKVPHVKR